MAEHGADRTKYDFGHLTLLVSPRKPFHPRPFPVLLARQGSVDRVRTQLQVSKAAHMFSAVAMREPALMVSRGKLHHSDNLVYLPINVVTRRLRTWQMSSGTNQMVAPIFRAMLMLSLALR